jgi:hypothetical protein
MVNPAFQTFEKERKSKQIEAAVVFGDVIRGNGHHLKCTELKFFGCLSVGTHLRRWQFLILKSVGVFFCQLLEFEIVEMVACVLFWRHVVGELNCTRSLNRLGDSEAS